MSAIKDRILGALPDDGEVALYAAAERVAHAWQEAYRTRDTSTAQWTDLPTEDRRRLTDVAAELLQRAVIEVGPHALRD